MGHVCNGDRLSKQRKDSNHYTVRAWSCRKRDISFNAGFTKQMVYQNLAFKGKYLFNFWESRNCALDVCCIRLFNRCIWLALDVYPRRSPCNSMGLLLVATGK